MGPEPAETRPTRRQCDRATRSRGRCCSNDAREIGWIPSVVPVPVIEVDLELGRIAEVVSGILGRRQQRKQDVLADLEDDLEAVGVIVSRMNRLYVDLLEEVQWNAIGSGSELENRDEFIQQIHHFLHEDVLVSRLIELRGRIQAASQSRRFRWRRSRDMVTGLRGLDQAISAYLGFLEAVQKNEIQRDSNEMPLWNLSTVLRLLEAEENPAELSLRELCEEAIRNRRIDLVHAIDDLQGQAVQHVRIRRL